jgi:uncharacterized protein YndB with AHSA1/START domain
METKEIKNAARGNEVSITRIVNAPRELVYECWTDAEHLKRWYFPNNCTVHFTYIDIKMDGGFHGAIIHKDDGRQNWFKAVFHEIVPPERLVFTLARADEKGNFITPEEAGMPREWPERTIVTLTFEDLGKQTRFTLHQTVDLDLATRTGAYPSWLQMLDRMESLIIK